LIFSPKAFSQVNGESQEIPKILMSVNEIRDFPVQGLRNFIITNAGVVDVQSIPTNILRIKVIGSGTTLIYIWDSQGRKAIQIEVTGLAPNQITTFRPGYDPSGDEFIYHTTMNNQLANGSVLSPFWNHEFSASIPNHKTNEWRTLLRASTIDFGPADASDYAPFSKNTNLDQILSYYQTPTYTAAIGDVNYNAGELSVTGFPLRGGSIQVYSENRHDQIQIFGGASRPQLRTTDLFNDPMQNFYGAAGTKEIFPNVWIKSSLVYLDQNATPSVINPTIYKDDFVADIGFQARPFTDKLNFEGEYGKSSDDSATRVLAEYTPFWGRILASHKDVGKNYITPSTFFLQKNYSETNFITDFKPTRKLGTTLNYQLTRLKGDATLLLDKTTVHRVQLNSLYQQNEEKSYLSGLSVTRANSASTPQSAERIDFTYQRFFTKTNNQFYAQFFGQHLKNYFFTESTEKFGGGTDLRYTKNFSRSFQIYLQNALQLNRVNSTFSNLGSSPKYIETIISLGPTVNFVDGKKTLSGGFYETLTFRDSFQQSSNVLQPFVTGYYNLSQALSLGTRFNLNIDFSSSTTYLSAVGELIYRFGSRVPDTLFSSFIASAQITGLVFIDGNNDGAYQPDEKIITNYTMQIDDQEPELIKTDRFSSKTDAGPRKITIQLPTEYQNYQFGTSNPAFIDLFPRETRLLPFAITQRIPIHGKVIVQQNNEKPDSENIRGLEAVKIEISSEGFTNTVETSGSGIFNTFVTKPGKYFAKLLTTDLPRGYKYTGPIKMEFVVEEGKITKIPSFVVQARRFVIGRVFVDKNGNNIFDEEDLPATNVKIQVGTFKTQSEEDGSFSFSTLPPGSYQINVEQKTFSGYRLTLLTDRLTIPEAGTVEINIPYQK
jgi:hypothetical protein